ncbi:MAG TPA: NIPSNAP family protein [Candidatus Elarobacter sp.]|jgi:hypothetical protein|nr:NIPSNAP family protein [Candidatus Elarobacter sp.]
MIVEVRNYKIKEGLRERFLDFFEHRAVPAQQAKGIRVAGPFVDLENPEAFIWMRAFPSLEERDRMKSAFYDGDPWKSELEAIAMPMLDSYTVALTSTTPGFVDDLQ